MGKKAFIPLYGKIPLESYFTFNAVMGIVDIVYLPSYKCNPNYLRLIHEKDILNVTLKGFILR